MMIQLESSKTAIGKDRDKLANLIEEWGLIKGKL